MKYITVKRSRLSFLAARAQLRDRLYCATFLLVTLCACCAHCATNLSAPQDRSWFTYFTNRICEFNVQSARVLKTPFWPPDSEHPPLPPKAAVVLAQSSLE